MCGHVCGNPRFDVRPLEGAGVYSWLSLSSLAVGVVAPASPNGTCPGQAPNTLDGLVCCHHKATWGMPTDQGDLGCEGSSEGWGQGGSGAGSRQLTSWASGGRCPEVSQALPYPWGTCPPTAPGGPEEEGA